MISTLQEFRDSVVCVGKTWTYPAPGGERWVVVLESGYEVGRPVIGEPRSQFKFADGHVVLAAPRLNLLEDQMWEYYRSLTKK